MTTLFYFNTIQLETSDDMRNEGLVVGEEEVTKVVQEYREEEPVEPVERKKMLEAG